MGRIKIRIHPPEKEKYRCSKCGRVTNEMSCCFEIVNGRKQPCVMEMVE